MIAVDNVFQKNNCGARVQNNPVRVDDLPSVYGLLIKVKYILHQICYSIIIWDIALHNGQIYCSYRTPHWRGCAHNNLRWDLAMHPYTCKLFNIKTWLYLGNFHLREVCYY